MKRRFLSVLLVLSMMLSMLPATEFQAFAEDAGAAEDMNALEALGIDTSVAPEGFNENDKSNPFGKDTVTLNPVGEIYTVGLNQITATTNHMPKKNDSRALTDVKELDDQILKGTLFGHEKWTLTSASHIMQDLHATTFDIFEGKSTITGAYKASDIVETAPSALQSIDVNTVVGGASIALTAVAAGNFDGNKDGKEAQVAMLYTSKLDKNGGLYLRTGDITGTYGTESKLLLSTTANIGNPSATLEGNLIETFDTDPYLMQNYIQITTGDYDGDGRDEIAVYIPELGKSRIEVYKLRTTTGTFNYKAASQWALAWTYSLKETTYVSNMVSLVSGDFNSDGVDDLAATWGYYYGPLDNKGSTAVVLFGSASDGRMLQNSQEFPLTYGNSDIVRGSFAYGDISGGGEDTLILGGQLNSDLAAENLNSRFVAFYAWDGKSFVQTQASNYNLFSKNDKGEFIYSPMTRASEIFYSSPLCVTNLDVIGQGLGEYAKLYIDSLLFSYSENGLVLEASLDDKTMQSDTTKLESYVEYGATATDLIGLGKETFLTMRQTFSFVETESIFDTVTTPRTYSYYELAWYYKNWFNKLFGIRTYYPVLRTVTITEATTLYDTNTYYNPGSTYIVNMDASENYTTSKAVDVSTSLCVANTDSDTTFLNYAGKYFVYSDPQILAVLASPPFFSDLLNRDDLSGNYGESTTSYSTTQGDSTGFNVGATISAGAYISAEKEFSFFGMSAVKVEAEASITASFTYEYEKTSSLEQTLSYTAAAGEDMVAFYSIPLEVFKYNASIPDGLGGYKTQTMTVNIPHEAAVRLLSLMEYESIAADYAILPQIADNVLTHTIGEPGSYPKSTNGYNVIAQYKGAPASVGFSSVGGGSAISQEIAMSTEESNAFSGSVAIDTKIGAGAGGVVVGVTLGVEAGAGLVKTSTSGSSFSGEIQNMPIEAQEYSYAYNWKMFSYTYNNGTSSFPVVNYLVSNVFAPPSLPNDFEQNVSKTTADAMVLTWSYDKTVAGFQLYRYYDFPEGSGSYELGFVSATSGIKGDDGRYYYSFTDEELAPYTEYSYQIQTVRAVVPNNSIKSEVLTVRTKTVNGYPDIQLSGDGFSNGVLPIYPDTTSTIRALVNNATDYPNGMSYQWQRLSSSGWTILNGETRPTLAFASSGSADQSQYRCRINVIYYDEGQGNTYYISAFSDPFYADYSKRTATLAEKGLSAVVTGDMIDLSLSLISGHANHFTEPTGTVSFIIKGVDYHATATGALQNDGVQGGKSIATAKANVKNLNDGVYEVSAIYNGSRVFKTLEIVTAKTVLIGDAAGYQLNLNRGTELLTGFVYGNVITPVLYEVTLENSEVTKTPISANVTYAIKNAEGAQIAGPLTGPFDAPPVGSYTLVAKVGLDEVAVRNFTISPKSITVKIANKTIGAGNVIGNEPVIALSEGSTMAFEETLDSLKLIYSARNTAENIIELNNATNPGNYIVTPMPGVDSVLGNYSITYISGVYTITAQTYAVTLEALKYQNTLAGTIELTNSGTMFSSSVGLIFAAKPYNGFEISSWTVIPLEDGGMPTTDETRWTTQTGKSTLYYKMKDEPIHVVVAFKKSALTLGTIVPNGGGSITLPPYFTNGSIVTSGAEMDFIAVPDDGYHFVKWEKIENNATTLLIGTDNDDDSNTLTLTMGKYNTRLYAYFERNSYTISLGANLSASYDYDHDGLSNTPDVKKIVYSGASIVGDTDITVNARIGYMVDASSTWIQSGSEVGTVATDNQSYMFTITEDTDIQVDTLRGNYLITVSSENGTADVTLDGVPASGASLESVLGGTRVTVTVTPSYGYAFDYWEINGEISNQNSRTLIVPEIGSALNIVAHFKSLENHVVEIVFDNPLRASFDYSIVDALGRVQVSDEKIQVPESSGDKINVFEGDALTIRVSPATNFMVGKWIIDGTVIDSRQKTYTFDAIQDDILVQVDMVAQSSHMVTFGPNIYKATTDGFEFSSGDYVGGGTTVIFYADPGIDNMIEQWIINNIAVLNAYNYPLVTETYTIDGLAGEINVDVTFVTKAFHEITINAVHTSWESTFEPMLDAKARAGASGVFTFTAEAGYRLDKSALVEMGVFDSVSEPDEAGKYTCLIQFIDEDITIDIESFKLFTITTESGQGGSLSVSTNTAVAGDEITIIATRQTNYRVSSVSATYMTNVGGETDLTITGSAFIMPDGDVTVKATFTFVEPPLPPEPPIPPLPPLPPLPPTPPTPPPPVPPTTDTTIDEIDIAFGDLNFIDVLEEMWNWAREAINELFKVKVVNGKREETVNDVTTRWYEPDGLVTRAEFAAMIGRLFTMEVIGENVKDFRDVNSTDWFLSAVRVIASNGVMIGDDGMFMPNAPITREEIATVIGRLLAGADYTVVDDTILSKFTDVASISPWAVHYAKLVVQEGIVNGRTATTFVPKANASRAEAAVMLYRLKGKVKTALGPVETQ